MRSKETRGVRVAPDAAQEHAASSAAERSGTLAQAEAAPRAQARRESSRRGAQRSCNPLQHRGIRQARGQRAAWRRSAAQGGCDAHARQKRAAEASGRTSSVATRSVQVKSHKTQGVSSAHLKAFQRSKQKGTESQVGGCNAHDAAQQRLQSLGAHRETMLRLTVQDEGRETRVRMGDPFWRAPLHSTRRAAYPSITLPLRRYRAAREATWALR